MSSPAHPVLDHIVILVSHDFLSNLPSWLTGSLTVLPGGTHSDGLTENKLVVFEDGVYLELIAFVEGVDPEKRRAHRWGRQSEGQIVDFACTLLQDGDAGPEARFEAVNDRVKRAGTGYGYTDPAPGGRITPDGTELKWAIAAPYSGSEDDRRFLVGELPFWCLDRTPRHRRVPHGKPEEFRHSSGAVGVASVTVSVADDEELAGLRAVYDAIADSQGKEVGSKGGASGYGWKFEVPFPGSTTHSDLVLSKKSFETEKLSMAFFTKNNSGRLEGDIGNGRRLVIDLIPLAE
jgi:hypothetical protein